MAMRREISTVLVVAALALAGCSDGGGDDDAAPDASDGSEQTVDDGTETPSDADGGGDVSEVDAGDTDAGEVDGGEVDCAAMEAALSEFTSVQLLAQIRDPGSIETLKLGSLTVVELDALEQALTELEVLDGYSNDMGDPAEAIDNLQAAVAEARGLFEADPVTQEAIDAYNESIGTLAEFLGNQVPISAALDEAGC